jgi:hypothetical protein
MDLIYSEPYTYKEIVFRISFLHDTGNYFLKIFRDNRPIHECQVYISKEEAQIITTSKEIVAPLENALKIAKKWISDKF